LERSSALETTVVRAVAVRPWASIDGQTARASRYEARPRVIHRH
jgi:hypothetical protein